MFSIDTNLLVYAHNQYSEFNKRAVFFFEKVLNERDKSGNLSVCLTTQVLIEFVNVITRQTLEKPLSIAQAIGIVNDYLACGIKIINPKNTQLRTFLELLTSVKTRKKVFDVALAATLKDNNVKGFYTVNIADFKDFDFLEVINPLQP
jgi:uncharacterized protein